MLAPRDDHRDPLPALDDVARPQVDRLARAEPIQFSGESAQNLIVLLNWASDPAVTGSWVASVLITENLTDLHPVLVESPYRAKIKIDLPTSAELREYVAYLTAGEERFERASEVDRDQLADALVGLSRVNVRGLVLRALRGNEPITGRYLPERFRDLGLDEINRRVDLLRARVGE